MLRSRSNTLKTNKSGVDMIFVLTVFVLFVCCLLAAVLAFAKAYKHFGSEIEKRFDTATAHEQYKYRQHKNHIYAAFIRF